MTDEAVEELSSGTGDDRPSPGRWRLVALCIAAILVVSIGVLLRAEVTHRRHLTLVRTQDKINVSLSLGAAGSSSDAAGHLVSASVEVEVSNHSAYPIYIERPGFQLGGVSLVNWFTVTRRLVSGGTTTMQVRYDVSCPHGVSPVGPGRLTVEVLSTAGRIHHLSLPLRTSDGVSDPVTQQLRQTCAALYFGDALTVETLRTTSRSATVVLHNHGRTRMEVRALGVAQPGFSVTIDPRLPLTLAARGQRRVTITFAVPSCVAHPSNNPSLLIGGTNAEPGGGPGTVGYNDSAIRRVLTGLTAQACHRRSPSDR